MSSLITWLGRTEREGGREREPVGIISAKQRESQSKQHQEVVLWNNRRPLLTASKDLGCPLPPDCRTSSSGSLGSCESPLSKHTRDGQHWWNHTSCYTKHDHDTIGGRFHDIINIVGIKCCCNNQNNVVYLPYFSRVGALSGRSFPRQREIKCELQTVPCQNQTITWSSSWSSKYILYFQMPVL